MLVAAILSASRAEALSVNFSGATDVPVQAASYTASGQSLTVTLGFAPTPGTNLMVVRNTGSSPIEGAFSNVAEGQSLTLSYLGLTYNFVATYFGGTGNDIMLLWPQSAAFSWGSNLFFQLGDGTAGDGSVLPEAVQRPGALVDSTITSVAGGGFHTLALTSGGEIYSWGFNGDGELGDGSLSDRNVPGPVFAGGALAGKRVIALAAGGLHSLALTADGLVFSWGYNGVGQLGDGVGSDHSVPSPVDASGVLAGKTIIAIACGDDHSLALDSGGNVYGWGRNYYGQLGEGTRIDRLSPVAVNAAGVLAGKTIVAISAGHTHSLALASDGTLYAWGYNQSGQLGNGTGADSDLPVAVNMSGVLDGKTVKAIAAGGDHNLVLTTDGRVYGWGRNDYGQLGDDSNAPSDFPVAVYTSGPMLNKTIVAIASGHSHSLALAANGQLFGWGNNTAGQLGDGGTSNSPAPVATNLSGALAGHGIGFIACGGNHSIVLAGAAQAPDIAIHQPIDRVLVDGLSTVDFGTAPAGTTLTRVFTIRNTGSANLTGIAITKTGNEAADFTVTNPAVAQLAPNGSTTFSVQFTASGQGARFAILHVASNDPDEAPFDIELRGTGLTESDVWRQTWFGNPLNTGTGADLADPDKDGIVNLIEFATKQNPLGMSGPVGTMLRNGNNLEYSYTCSKAALADGVLFVAEWTDNLASGPWSTLGVSTTVVDHDTTETVTATVPVGPNGYRFMRLRILRP